MKNKKMKRQVHATNEEAVPCSTMITRMMMKMKRARKEARRCGGKEQTDCDRNNRQKEEKKTKANMKRTWKSRKTKKRQPNRVKRKKGRRTKNQQSRTRTRTIGQQEKEEKAENHHSERRKKRVMTMEQ